MSFEYREESGYNLGLDLLTILLSLHVSHPRRSGLVGKTNHLRPIYLKDLRLYGWFAHLESTTLHIEVVGNI